jgi:hypothetical protein
MRRLDFEIVAQAMNDAKPRNSSEDRLEQWRTDCETLADAFAAQSTCFDRVRFFKNCGCTPARSDPPPGVKNL